MINKYSLLSKKEYKITDNLIIHIPTVREVHENQGDEEKYFELVSLFTKTPCDAMVELDDMGKDYTQIKEYELFTILFVSFMAQSQNYNDKYWKMIFPYLDLKKMQMNINNENMLEVYDENGNIVINEQIYLKLADVLRNIIFTEKNMEHYKVPEVETRKYIIQRQRLKRQRELERQKRYGKKSSSQIDGALLFLVNNANFKYNFETVKDITLYDLFASLQQINQNINVDGLMSGYWTGNVDLKKVDKKTLNRMIL